LPRGETVNFQAQGRPEQGMSGIAMQMVRHFQRTSLPTESEYDFLSILGDWNGGVSLGHQFWALADNHIMSPDTRNPSPVRHPEEVNGKEFSFYCVR